MTNNQRLSAHPELQTSIGVFCLQMLYFDIEHLHMLIFTKQYWYRINCRYCYNIMKRKLATHTPTHTQAHAHARVHTHRDTHLRKQCYITRPYRLLGRGFKSHQNLKISSCLISPHHRWTWLGLYITIYCLPAKLTYNAYLVAVHVILD